MRNERAFVLGMIVAVLACWVIGAVACVFLAFG